MNFYHDQTRNLLVYRNTSQFLTDQLRQAIPEAREINGHYLAVPRNLHSCQVLRHFGYPVPPVLTDLNYKWPRHPSIAHPYESQKLTTNFMILHPRSFILSDMGCVAGETLIDTAYGKVEIATLAEAAKPVPVRTLTLDGPRLVEIPAPFRKGRADLYRVKFQSGRSIVVTKRHVFLTCRGWTSCESLRIGESLPVFDAYPQQSIWEPCRVKLLQGDHHLTQITLNSQGCSESFVYDEPPLLVTSSDQFSIPSLGGVLKRFRFGWRTDARGNKHICTDPTAFDPRSTLHYGVHFDQGEMGFFLSEYATKLTGNQVHICVRYHLFPSQLQEVPSNRELRLCIPVSLATKAPFDIVTHIGYERTDNYYDMQVPEHENYVAHGLCHHNTGKTMSTLWAADAVMRMHKPGTCRALIVCPLSIMQRVWSDGIFKNFLGNRTCSILHGDSSARTKALARSVDFYVVNFDGVGIGAHTRKRFELDGFSRALAEREDIKIAIVDEASAYKDSTTKRHRIARQVFGKKDYLWLLTGTPTPNAPTDSYGLAKLVNNAMGKSNQSFRMETMYQPFPNSFKWLPRKDGYEKARALLKPSIRFSIEDVWDSPPMTTQMREVELTVEQKKLMADLKKDFVITVKSGAAISAVNEAAARIKFVQISLGAIYDQNHKIHAIDAAPRHAELIDVLEQAPGKVIVFSPLTSVINIIYKNINKRWPSAVVNGEVSQKERSNIFQAFQDLENPLRVLVADAQTMAHGLDLFAARVVVWFGPSEKAELYAQANARMHRPGQRFPTTVVQLVSNSLEREIFRRLENNLALQGALLDLVKANAL